MEPKIIVYRITAFIMGQKIQVLNAITKEVVEEQSVKYSDMPKTFVELAYKYNVDKAFVRGIPGFKTKAIEDIKKQELLSYSKNFIMTLTDCSDASFAKVG